MEIILEKIASFLNRLINIVSGAALVAMTLVIMLNIILRFFNRPLEGTIDIICFLTVIVVGFSLGHTQIKRGHVAIDILVSKFPARSQNIIEIISFSIGMLLFAIATWQLVLYGLHVWKIGSLSETLRIIYFPFIYCLAFGCGYLSFILFIELYRSILKAGKK